MAGDKLQAQVRRPITFYDWRIPVTARIVQRQRQIANLAPYAWYYFAIFAAVVVGLIL